MIKNFFFLPIILSFAHVVSVAQYERAPSCELTNPELITQLKKGIVNGISLWDRSSSYGQMASSTRGPSGVNPHDADVIAGDPNGTDDEKEEAWISDLESFNASNDWICQYAAYNLTDGLPSTAWVEGAQGDGIGEAVIAGQINPSRPVKIWAGYGKSQKLFKANNRPAKVRMYLLATHCPRPSQFATYYDSLIVIGTSEVTLKDLNGYQTVVLPGTQKKWSPIRCDDSEDERPGVYFIAIEILSVYKGSRYHDTCISEIRN